jgi:hypothetical protein
VRIFRWEGPSRLPRHPYRDSALFYALLAGILVGVTALTGGDVRRSVFLAIVLFVAATGYSWWRWRERLRRQDVE